MAKIVYVKLVTGEQLLATMVKYEGDVVVLDNPLELSFNESENGNSFIYLARYSPFMAGTVIRISRDHLVHIEPVMDKTSVYYDRSLQYVRMKSDVGFSKGVDDAITYIEDLITRSAKPRAKREEQSLDDMIEDLTELLAEKVTVH